MRRSPGSRDPGPLLDYNHARGRPRLRIRGSLVPRQRERPAHGVAGYGPDGTPGRLIISQTGFFRTTFKGATADAFPAEFVEVRATGN